jgi:Transposase IS116/IS110/IS902 family
MPVDRPSGLCQLIRHRLNRDGDRQLNRAIHTIALARLAHHTETKQHAAKGGVSHGCATDAWVRSACAALLTRLECGLLEVVGGRAETSPSVSSYPRLRLGPCSSGRQVC